MSTTEINNNNYHHELRRSLSESRDSMPSSDDQGTPVIIDDAEDDELISSPIQEIKTLSKPKQQTQIPKPKNSQNVSSSLKWSSTSKTR